MKSIKLFWLRVIIIIASLIVATIIFAIVSYTIDSQRIRENDIPFFACQYNEASDGGTEILFGLGYHIVKWHRVIKDTDYEMENKDYVCGWDINIGYDYKNTVSHGPQPEQTYNFHFE